MTIRRITVNDVEVWSRFRTELWPNTNDGHRTELEAYFNGSSIDIEQAYIVENESGDALGFIELNIREFAEGSRHPRVPYIEAWFVDADHRGQGYGKQLIEAAEHWAKLQGYDEIASDTEVTNTSSISAHKQLGFVETERVVCFLKRLD